MRIEVKSAADFLIELVKTNNPKGFPALSGAQLDKFREHVCDILVGHYTDHWFPDRPFKGSGYRCIRINGTMDPLIARAGLMMGIAAHFLRAMFPSELTMWVDPMEVSYRIGENGSICVLYEDENAPTMRKSPSPASPNASSSPSKAMISSRHPLATPSPPPHLSSSPPPHLSHLLQQQQHFSPSKTVQPSKPSHHYSPPSSPLTTHQHQQQQHALAMQQLSMFLGSSMIKCAKELPRLEHPRRPDPLFVAS